MNGMVLLHEVSRFWTLLTMSKSITLECKRDTRKNTANLNYQFKKRLENKV